MLVLRGQPSLSVSVTYRLFEAFRSLIMALPLPPSMAMLLPKGLVENTAEVYAEVASYPVIPPEKIYEYWHGTSHRSPSPASLAPLMLSCSLVYTTTFRKLIDPTAHRLENFWWHVWGSDRRYLSGPALARIYEEISKGPTFVPLRGPPNRYEGPPVKPILLILTAFNADSPV